MLYVALGSALGGVARYLLSNAFARPASGIPWTTLGINVLGAFVVGLVTRLAVNGAPLSLEARVFLTVGVCGGFTTFSAFSYEVLGLMEDGAVARAAIYATASVLLSLAGVAAGVWVANAARGPLGG